MYFDIIANRSTNFKPATEMSKKGVDQTAEDRNEDRTHQHWQSAKQICTNNVQMS
jgi:hypothetical protein